MAIITSTFPIQHPAYGHKINSRYRIYTWQNKCYT